MEIEFDFKEEKSRLFGPVLRPVARVILIGKGIEVPQNVYVDSGADVTIIPKSVGDLLGLTIEKTDSVEEIKGIGDQGIPIVPKLLRMHIGERVLQVRVAWALIEEVPLLLGRLDVFPLFDICFCKGRKTSFVD